MDGDYLPITYGDENLDTQFLVKTPSCPPWGARFVPSNSHSLATHCTSSPTSTGHFCGTNVKSWTNGPHNCRTWASLWETSTIVCGDVLPSQPGTGTRSSNPELDPILAHAPITDPQNLATHCRGRRLDAILLSPTAWDIHPPISADTINFPHAGDHKSPSHRNEPTAAGAAAGHWQCVALPPLVIPQVFAPHVPMVQSAPDSPRSHHAPTGQGGHHHCRGV